MALEKHPEVDHPDFDTSASLTGSFHQNLREVLSKEKDLDRVILVSALVEYCDHSGTRHECPIGSLCFK